MTLDLFAGADNGASFSPCRAYRYQLRRRWAPGPLLAWLLCNPSDANETGEDPTSRRCHSFSKAWGFGGDIIVNPFAVVDSEPSRLAIYTDPVGPENDRHILDAAHRCKGMIAGWGQLIPKDMRGRLAAVEALVRPHIALECLGLNADGTPKHPLYLAKSTVRIAFRGRG